MIAQSAASVNPSRTNVAKFPTLTIPAVHAVRDARLPGHEKAVLFALASRLPCVRPSVALVCQDCGFGRSKVLAVLRSLEKRGMVRRTRLGGRYGTNAYELDLGAILAGVQGSPGRPEGSVLGTPEGSVLGTQRGKREKRQDQKRADAEPGGAGKREVQEVPQDNPTPTTPPPAQAVRVTEEVGDRPSDAPPPASGRFELPDVCPEEPKAVDREVDAMRGRRDRGERLVSEPRHLAAAFDAGHEAVYGFPSPELRGPKLWKCAVAAAGRLVNEFFGGDLAEAERYVVWAWERERRARKAGRERDRPVGWRLMLGPVMATDYMKFRADRARRAA